MIIELCKGGPYDGLKEKVDTIPVEWRKQSKMWPNHDVVYKPRQTEISETQEIVKFDFVGWVAGALVQSVEQ